MVHQVTNSVINNNKNLLIMANNNLQDVKYIPIETKLCNGDGQHEKRPDTLYLYFVVITGILMWFVGGMFIVWTSPALVKLNSNDTTINPLGRPITTSEVSMILGIQGLIAIFGAMLLPKLADLLGRKTSLQVLGLGMFVSLVGLAFSNSVPLIIVFYAAFGTIFAGVIAVFPIYLTEICEDHNRTKFGSLMSLCIPLGQLYVYIIGPLFTIQSYTLLVAAPMVIFLILFFFVPESPVYSLTKGKADECMRSLKKLRKNKTPNELEIDFNNISQSLSITDKSKKANVWELLKTREGTVGVVLGIIPLLTQYLSGVPVLMPLMAPIFNELGLSMSGNMVAICVGIVKVFSFSLPFLIIERVGRKPLLVISSAGAGICVSILGIFFYLKYINSPINDQFRYGPLICILSYIIFYSLGLGSIPYALISVLFPANLRSAGASFILTTVNVLVTIYLTVYPILSEAIGIHWCMWVFGFACILGASLMYLIMPETKGKSTEEIQELLKKY